MTLANYLYALVYSDMYDEDRWKNWAESILLDAQYDNNTEWVYNVFLATSKQKLFDAISERMVYEDYFMSNKHVLTEIIQGYYYYQYQINAISLYEMLEKSGDVADAGQDAMGCEVFYSILNKIDENSSIINSMNFIKSISSYFNPLCIAAIEQKRKLETATLENLYL